MQQRRYVIEAEVFAQQFQAGLRQALEQDPAFALFWRDRVATAMYDAVAGWVVPEHAHEIANTEATRFMEQMFGVKMEGS